MDLVSALTSAAGIDTSQAQALAGAVLGTARKQADEAEAAKLDEAVPELSGWVDEAQKQSDVPDEAPKESFLGSLASFAGSPAGGAVLSAVGGEGAQEKAQVVAVLSKVGLTPGQAALAAPVVLSFLEQRLGEEWVDRLVAAAPILSGVKALQADDAGAGTGGLADVAKGALGSLFG
jgi:hypothetical protein